MKIVHIISNFSLSYGGMATACKEIAEGQAKVGLDVTIITSNLDHPIGILKKPFSKTLYENGVRLFYCPVFFKPLVFSFKLLKLLRQEISNADVVHVHGLFRFPQTFSCWYANIIGKPYVLSPHGSLDPAVNNNKDRYFRRHIYQMLFEKNNINNADKIHFTALGEKTLTNNLIPAEKGFIIPNGINTGEYKKLPSNGFFEDNYNVDVNSYKILFLGRITWKKGLDILLPALNIIKEIIPNIILLIVGPDNEGYKNKLKKMIEKLNISKYIKFIGLLDKDSVKKAYVDSDIFVLPSYSENFGLTIIESMACACPVVISKNVNIHEDISRNNLGYVIDCKPKEIAESVIDYYRKPDIYKKNHKKIIRHYALSNYDWDRCITMFIKIYKKILEYNNK